MSTSVYPPIAPADLKKAEDETLARELSWLLSSLQETLENLKSGLDDCYALLAAIEPGSTLVVSSVRSEAVKGTITRVGTRIVKGSLALRLKTCSPLQLSLDSNSPLILPPLTHLRNLLNDALDCVDITRWTGDRQSAPFISGQLRLLHSILVEAKSTLQGHPRTNTNIPGSEQVAWTGSLIDAACFTPRLPEDITIELSIQEAALVLVVRTVEDAHAAQNFGTKLAFAIGAQRRLEHDEMEGVYTIPRLPGAVQTPGAPGAGGRQVRVKEKVRVESADPSLMSMLAKVAALEHNASMARCCLGTVMGDEYDD